MKEEISIEEQKGRRNLYLGTTIVSALSTGVVVGCAAFNGFVLTPTVPIALVIAGGATVGNAIAWRKKANTVSDLELDGKDIEKYEGVKTTEDETVKVKSK